MSYTQAQIQPLTINALSSSESRKTREIAERVAKALGLASVEEAGLYASGKAILPSLVTNALNALKAEGRVYKVGHGRWQAGAEPTPAPIPAPIPAPTLAPEPEPTPEPEPEPINLVEMVKAEADAWFDLTDKMTLDWVISQQPCWGTWLKSDQACGECLLADACRASKAEVKARKKAEKEAEEERIAWSVPSDVDLNEAMRLTAKRASLCVASGEAIPSGAQCVFISNWGVVTTKVADDLGIA